jgi:hypothetical protein
METRNIVARQVYARLEMKATKYEFSKRILC